MKTTFATLALSLIGATYAAPSTVTRSTVKTYPFSIDDIKLYHLIESNTWDLTVSVTQRDANSNPILSTSCHAAWIDGSDYIARQPCLVADYYVSLPYGAKDPEEWTIKIDGPEVAGEGVIASGPKYQCGPYEGPIGNIDTACVTKNGGWFFLQKTEHS